MINIQTFLYQTCEDYRLVYGIKLQITVTGELANLQMAEFVVKRMISTKMVYLLDMS